MSVGGGYNRLDVAKMDNPWTINKGSKTAISVPQYDWELKVAKINEGGCFVEQTASFILRFRPTGGDTKSYCVGLIEFTGDYKKDDLNNKQSGKSSTDPCLNRAAEYTAPGAQFLFRSPDGSELCKPITAVQIP